MAPPESNYCYEHSLFFEDFCPDCRLEEWEFYNHYLGTEPGEFKETNSTANELFTV